MFGPDYRRPKVEVPNAYIYEPQQTAETANTAWWQQFGDPVLDQLITEAIANNKSVQIAAANVEQAAGLLTQTRSPLFPQVNYQGDAARQRATENGVIPLVPGTQNPVNTHQVFAAASWEIDLWGRVRRLTEAAQANLLATEEARRGVILSLVAAVGTSYLQLRGLDEQLAISKTSLETYGESLALFETKFKYGQISQMNVEQVRVQYETAAAQIPAIEQQIALTENALSVLLGRNPGPIPRGKSLSELALPEVPAGLPSQLLEQRPDLLQSEQQLIAANAQIGAAKALYFPTISLTGALGAASTDLSDLFKGPSQIWSFGGSIIGPIFTGGAIKGQVVQATAGQKAALGAYELAIQNAFADVENALVSRQKLGEQIAAQERLVRALKEYSRYAYLNYDGGYAPYTDVLTAEQQRFPAELNLASQRAQLLASVVSIYRATGGGWVELAQNTSNAPAKAPEQQAGGGTAASALQMTEPANDRIEVAADGEASVVNVYRVRGIGGAQVRAPKSGWPRAVLIRLHGFPQLESLKATARGQLLDCQMHRVNGASPQYECTIDGRRADVLERKPGYFQVKLPASFLAADGTPVEVHWVDQWR
jgi:multidrug efflux system outer membrane protein